MKDGEVVCKECDGLGVTPADLENDITAQNCHKCHGHGKLDWVENARGGKQGVYPTFPQGFDGTGSSIVTAKRLLIKKR